MKLLAIETSCDETALALVDVKQKGSKAEFTILGNHLASQIALHAQYGGVFPMMAKREHAHNIIPVFLNVLKQAKVYAKAKTPNSNIKLEKKIAKILEREHELNTEWQKILPFIQKPKVDAIAVTTGPGLEPALWVGINFARALGEYWNLPVIPTNHMEGHIFSIFPKKGKKFTIDTKEKIFPMLSLLVSGGHTELVLAHNWQKYKKIGQTRDDAVGEAFDKVARMLGLPYPGGPEISKLAQNDREKNTVSKLTFPRPMIHSKDFDFSFSGLKTAVLYHLRDNPLKNEKEKLEIAREFEDASIEVLVEKTIRAVEEYKIKTLIVGGGVSANTYLKTELTTTIKNKKLKTNIHFPIKGLHTDNALMIAIAGYFQYQKKKKSIRMNSGAFRAEGNLSL